MNIRHIVLPLALALLTGCTTNRNPNAPTPVSDGATKIYDADTGQLLASSEGKSAAGGGRVIVNNVSQVSNLAPHISPGTPFAYSRMTYSRVNAVAVQEVKAKEEKYKSAQSALESLVKGGVAAAKGNYAEAVKEAGAAAADAYKSWQEAQTALANAPQPAQGNLDGEVLVVGPDAGATVALVAESTANTVKAGLVPSPVNTRNTTETRTDITTEAETLAGLSATKDVSLAAIGAAIDLARLKAAKANGGAKLDEIVDDEDGPEAPTAPVSTKAYDSLSPLAKKFLWKSRYSQALGRGTGTIFVPGDRPKIKSAVVTFADGSAQTPTENYFSESQERQRLVFVKPYPAGAASAKITYADGGTETFALPNAHARREYLPGAYKSATPSDPVTPAPPAAGEPPNGAPAALTATGIHLRSNVAEIVTKILVIEDAKTNTVNPPKILATRVGNGWTTGKPLSEHRGAVYQIWFSRTPPSDVPHHPRFPNPDSEGIVGHFTQEGKWDPDTVR